MKLAVLSLILAGLPSGNSRGAEPAKARLVVGIILRLSEQYDPTPRSFEEAIETARDAFEQTHAGYAIELRKYEHGNDLESVLKAADKAINDGIPALIGGEISRDALILGEKFTGRKIVLVTPTSSMPKVTENRPYVFRMCPTDDRVAKLLARFTVNQLSAVRLAALRNASSPYSDYLATEFLKNARMLLASKKGAENAVVLEESFVSNTADFGPSIERFKRNGITHVAALFYEGDLIRFYAQAAAAGFFPTYVGSDGWGSNETILQSIVKESPFGQQFTGFKTSYWKEDEETGLSKMFIRIFTEKFKKRPDPEHAIAFDAAWLLFSAMARARESGMDIRDQLLATRSEELVTAPSFAFGKNDSPETPIHFFRLDRAGIHYEVSLR